MIVGVEHLFFHGSQIFVKALFRPKQRANGNRFTQWPTRQWLPLKRLAGSAETYHDVGLSRQTMQ